MSAKSGRHRPVNMTTDMAGSTVLDSIKALRQNFQRDEASGAHMTELKLRNAQLESANETLKHRLQDALQSPLSYRSPASNTEVADLAAMLQNERAQHETRNARALALLRSKDDALEAAAARCAGAEAEAADLRSKLQSTTRQLDAAKVRVQELADQNSSLRKKAAEAEAQHETQLTAAMRELEVARRDAEEGKAAQAELVEIRGAYEGSEERVDTLTAALKAADEIMEDMQQALQRREAEQAQAKQEIETLEGYVGSLLGVAMHSDTAAALAAALQEAAAPGHSAAHCRQLEQSNEALKRALVQANLRLVGIDPSAHSTTETLLSEVAKQGTPTPSEPLALDPSTIDDVVRLTSEIVTLRSELAKVKARAAQLESVHGVAQGAALHAEVELQAALDREREVKQQKDAAEGKLERAERRAAVAAAELASLRLEMEESVASLTEALSCEKEKAAGSEARIVELTTTCQQLSENLAAHEAEVEKARQDVAASTAASADVKEAAASRVAAVLRQCGSLKEQMLAAQEENDELKSLVADYERKAAFHSAKTAAQEAAASMMVRMKGSPSQSKDGSPLPPLEELVQQLRQAAIVQAELHEELKAAELVIAANEKAMAGMQGSIHRLRAALKADPDHGSEPEQEEAAMNHAARDVDASTKAKLREQLARTLAAQEGQASAFAALAIELQERERDMLAQLEDKEGAEEARLQAEALCVAAVGAMHGALAQVALAEGDDDAAEGLLRAEVDPADLAHVTAAIAAKVEAYARLIARQQQGVEGTALAEAQRDVIKTLSAQLDSAGRDPVRAPSAHSHHAEVQCSPSKVAHLTGLCALIARQVEDFRAAAHEGVPSELEAVLNTLHVLHNELTMLGADHEAHKVPALPGAEQPTAPPSPSVAGSTRQEESEAQIIELAEKVAALTQRIALLTASNAAAQEEAAQARAAAVSLAEEVDVVQCEARRAIAQRAEENEAIMQQLAQAHAECRRLAAALAEADDAALLKETALREAMAKQAQAREPRDGFANPLTQQQQERPHPPAGLAALLDGMDGLLADAAAMEERLHQLEGQAAEAAELRSAAAQNRWQGLTVAAACAQGAAAAWAGARADVTAAEQRCAEHAQRAKQLAEHVRQLEAENTELCRRLDAMRALHDEQSSRMAELHAAQLAAAEAKLHAQKQELNRHADAAVAAAVAAAEAHTKERVGQGLEDALRELEGCQRECVRLRAERDAAYAEFKRFREIKAAEVQLLEQRLGLENGVSSNAADADEAEMLVAAASGEIAAACRADAVAAALREAKLERKHRMEVQHALAALRAEEKKAQAARKAAEKEAAALRQRLREASVAAEQQIRELTTQVTQARKEADATLAAAADQAVEVLSLNERLEKTAAAVVERNRRLQAVEEAEVDKARAALAARSAALRDVAGRVMRAEHEVELLKDDLDKCSVTSQEDDVFQ